MKNKKGFTLVELLVVIVILGIITGISIPLIRNIQAKNEQKQYQTYQDSLKVSARLYVDSYEEDLFGHSKSGCAIITYQQLQEKGLLKDIAIGDVSCATSDTLVRVVKVDGKISYTPMIGCGKVVGDSVEIDTILPEGGVSSSLTCGVDAHTIISFDTEPTHPDTSINYQKRNITVLLNSYTGFYEENQILYGFSSSKPDDENQEPTLLNGWHNLKVNYIGGNEQKKIIEEGREIQLSSESIITPDNLTGDYYVVLKIESLKDISGRDWTNDPNQSKYIYLGTFRLDNQKPVFADTSGVVSSNSSYHHIQPKLSINVTDNYSNSSNLRMCVSYDSDSCSKTVSDIKNNVGYVAYNGSQVLDSIPGGYNGSNHTVYVTVGDAAGNYETKTYSYQVAIGYTLTYHSNGGSSCNPGIKTVIFDSGNTVTWGNLCTPTRNNYKFDGWHVGSASGSTVTSTTAATSNIDVYAKWQQDKCWERRVKGECGRWRECDYERRSTSWTSEPDCDHYCAGSNWGHENRRCVCYRHGRDPSCGCEYHRWSDWERVQSCTPEPDRVQCRNVC